LRDPLAAFGRLAIGGVVLATACSRERPADSPGATLEARWVGSDTGMIVAPAVAEWCDSLRLLEVRAVHGDTGIALLLYPADSLTPGPHRVVPPERGDSTRPSGAVALRWFAETSIRGFRADSGSVTLSATGPGVGGGSFVARLRSTTDGSRLHITGSFRGLTVHPASPECAGVPKEPGDTEPDPEEGAEETTG
jgi:hypothetical protein